jgi:hypothetical protein
MGGCAGNADSIIAIRLPSITNYAQRPITGKRFLGKRFLLYHLRQLTFAKQTSRKPVCSRNVSRETFLEIIVTA